MMRLQKIRKGWEEKFDAFLVFKPEFIENQDIAYATGFTGSTAIFLQTLRKNYLIVDFRYKERAQREVCEGINIINLLPEHNFFSALKMLFKREKIKKVGVESYVPVGSYERVKKDNRSVRFEVVKSIISDVRAIKAKGEIVIIRKAQKLTDQLFHWFLGELKPGEQTEKEIAILIQNEAVKRGAEGLAFPPIIASDKNTSVPHYAPANKKIPSLGPLLIDFGIKLNGYCSDLTRTIWIGKKPTKEFVKAYQVVLQAQEKGIETCCFKGKKLAKEIDAAARKVIENSVFKGAFGHSLGHGVGMDIHEAPHLSRESKDVLYGNEVITIEPGIYLEGKFGVRIEDLVITGSGEVLTHAPKRLIAL